MHVQGKHLQQDAHYILRLLQNRKQRTPFVAPKHGYAREGKNRVRRASFVAGHERLNRCRRPKDRFYKPYGGRGIKVCDRWQGPNGFSDFLADMGERPDGLTLDRKDNDGNYEAGNCRWATGSERRHAIAVLMLPAEPRKNCWPMRLQRRRRRTCFERTAPPTRLSSVALLTMRP